MAIGASKTLYAANDINVPWSTPAAHGALFVRIPPHALASSEAFLVLGNLRHLDKGETQLRKNSEALFQGRQSADLDKRGL